MFVVAWKLEMCAVQRMGARRYEEALECYREMMERVKPSAHHWEMMAQCYEWVGETEKAERAARCALEAEDDRFEALRLLARVSIAQGHYAQAREYVQKALRVKRRSPSARRSMLFRMARFFGEVLGKHRVGDNPPVALKGPERDDEQWDAWAREFLSGYEQVFGSKSNASGH